MEGLLMVCVWKQCVHSLLAAMCNDVGAVGLPCSHTFYWPFYRCHTDFVPPVVWNRTLGGKWQWVFLQTRCRCCYTVSSVRAVKESQSKPVAWPHRFFIYHRTVDKPVACSGQIKKKAVGGRDRERGRVWGGGIPLPIACRVCGGGRASSPENFWSISCERMHFGAPFIEEYR